jgi:DNA-binding response OmpR family regulator
MKVLYIDDNRLLAHSVKKILDPTYVVDLRLTGREGIATARSTKYAVILLDLCLPDMNGLDVCRELRRHNVGAPILVLTVQKDPLMSVQLLNCGADDYVTKPFNSDVLKARIAALLRRGQEVEVEKIIGVSDLKVNVTRRQVWRSGVKIPLRRKEFDILEYLAANRGRTLTRAMIIDHVWESGKEGWNNTVDVHIKNLRDKIDRPFDKALIKTTYGIGYMIDDSA